MNEQEIVNNITDKAREMLEQMEFGADINTDLIELEGDDDYSYINLEIRGEDLGLLIGYQGGGLRSFERVMNLMLNKMLRGIETERRYKVIVDINDYKTKREKLLKETVYKAIEHVKESNQPVELSVMNPADRRIVHMVIQEEAGITSQSEGEEGERRVIIMPE